MSPFTDPVLELRLITQKAEAAAAKLPATPGHSAFEDHRTAVLGELLDAVDRIDSGLGERLLRALYPVLRTAQHGERRSQF